MSKTTIHVFQAVQGLKKFETLKVEQVTITPDESMLFNIKQENHDEAFNETIDSDSKSEWVKNEEKTNYNTDQTSSFSCKHCNKTFDEPNLLISHISSEHNNDGKVKKAAKKDKNPKIPCGECGKLYSDSGLRAHMIRVSVACYF